MGAGINWVRPRRRVEEINADLALCIESVDPTLHQKAALTVFSSATGAQSMPGMISASTSANVFGGAKVTDEDDDVEGSK